MTEDPRIGNLRTVAHPRASAGAGNEDIMAARTITKAFLIYPPTGLYDRADRCQAPIESETVFMIRPPMDLAYMAAALERDGIACRIADYPAERKDWNQFKRDFKEWAPEMLVVSSVVPTFERDCAAFRIAKEFLPGIRTVIKGFVEGAEGGEELRRHPELDILVHGEPEFAVAEIATGRPLATIAGITYRDGTNIAVTPPRSPLANLDLLPFPARHLLNLDLYRMPDTRRRLGIVLASKGCPFNCIFCLVPRLYGQRVIFRSPVSLVDEIEQCVNEFGIRDFWFRADTFTLNKQWVIEVCKAMIHKKLRIRWTTNSRVDTIDAERLDWMKRAGCFAIGFGIESGNQEILDKIQKGITLDQCRNAVRLCKERGILTYLFFMIGLPWESRETVRQTVAFARELDGDICNFSIAYPFPGSGLYRIAIENNLIASGTTAKGDYSTPAMGTLFLAREEVARLEKWANRKLLLRPAHAVRVLLKLRSPSAALRYIRGGIRMLRYSLRNGSGD